MKIEISVKTILITLAILAGGWLVIQIQDILFLLFIGFLLMTAIHPMVVFLERFRVPRFIGILLIYFVVFGLFGASLIGAIPALVSQSAGLIEQLPQFISQVLPYWNIDVSQLTQQIAPVGQSLVKLTLDIFSNIVSVLTVLVFTFYFLLERRNAQEILTGVFGLPMAVRMLDILRRIESRLGSWVRGELILMTAVGLCSYIGLSLLHVEFALPLAILAGLLEVIPMVGPTVSAIPAVLVALATSPFLALSVAALYIIVQQLENNILVPYIMKKSVGFAPLVTILILLIGGRLAGIAGAVLSVPIALVVQEIITDFLLQGEQTIKKTTKNPSR